MGASELEKKLSKDKANLEGLGEPALPPMSDEFILGTRRIHLLAVSYTHLTLPTILLV